MMEKDENTVVDINPDTQPIAYAQQTRADRLREASNAPDFSIPEVRPIDAIFSESSMNMTPDMVEDMMRETGIYASTGQQTATAIKNAFIGMNQMGDEIKIAYGNLANYFTGSSVGDEMAQIAYESIAQRYSEMANGEEAIGGIRSNLAQLVGGATSFLQLALEGIATAGVLPLAHIGIQEFGQGAYNDMKAYADEHDGSLKGYKPKGFDLAANTANALLQVGIERWKGVGSPRFLLGASKGLWKEGLNGALQEGVQGALHDLNEAIKGNEEISILLDNAEDYLRDAIVGGILQGGLGAVTHHQNYARAVNNTSEAIAKARGHETPTAEDKQQAQAIIDAKEREEASILTKEFKAAFDASSGEGQLQKKIADALNAAVKNKELDLDTADETELAQRIEQIATQETMNAMDLAREQNRSIADMELNNIVYKDGAIWLEGLTPQVGDRAVSYARVLAERQSGLAEVNSKLDAINQEIATLKQDLAEAKAENKQAQVEKLQARIDKQNALAEKNRLQAERLKVQTAKLEKQIAKQEEKAKLPETVKTEKVSAEVKPVEAPKVESPKREVLAQVKKKQPVAERKSLKEERVEKKKTKAEKETEQKLTDVYNKVLKQGSITGKGDTARGGYDDALKRIILGEKSDLSTIQHEFAHYWIQNNFKWARSGLASQDWLRRWRDVEEWLGIEPQDRLLSKSASEKFAKAYERYILEGKVAPELQWAFEGFQKAYQDIYEDLENEYFDLSEELAPEVVDWFNRNKEQSPKRMLQSDEQKIEKALTLAAGGAVVEQAGTDAVVMTENNEKGEPVVTMGVKQSEVPAGDNLLVYSDKATASKLQQSARKVFGDDVEVQKLATLDTQATLENFTNWIKRDRAGAWDAMMDPSTSPIYQAYLYKAFAQEAMNDVDLAVQLANVDMAKAAREMGQAVQALNINNESGFDMLEIIRNLEKSKGTVSEEELNNSIEEMGLDVEMTEEQVEELKNETECKL